MRAKIITYLKSHTMLLTFVWNTLGAVLSFVGFFVPVKKNRILFASFGGRGMNDSPKALYEEILNRAEFENWDIIWAFVNPEKFSLPRGRKVKIDTPRFFCTLLTSQVWISNSGMSRGMRIRKSSIIQVETWHGTPIKKIGGEENTGTIANRRKNSKIDTQTIRCAQSTYDRDILSRVEEATIDSYILADLPRNDRLAKGIDVDESNRIKEKLNIPLDKRIALYAPTYREFSVDENMDITLTPPIDFSKWRASLSDTYVLLIRAHYAVTKSMGIVNDGFLYDVSGYDDINDLYLISDLLISDYSSSFIDYSILHRPMLCFAYDLEEYSQKRGLYVDLNEMLPCAVDMNEDEVISHILYMDNEDATKKTEEFQKKYAPFAGHATEAVIDKILERLNNK